MRRVLLALFVAACGGREIHHTPDAMDDAAPPDVATSTGDPTSGSVTLTITRGGAPVAGATVVFQADLTSTPVATLATDEHGRAFATLPADGLVTAIEHTGSGVDELTTFSAVQPGDNLRLDLDPTGDTSSVDVTINVPMDTGADGYSVETSCGSTGLDGTATGALTLTGCGGSIDVTVTSYLLGDPTGRVLYATGLAVPTNGTLTVTGTYAALVTHTLTYTGVPALVSSVGAVQILSPTHRAFLAGDSAPVASGMVTLHTEMPDVTTPQLTATTLYPRTPNPEVPSEKTEPGEQSIFDWGAAAPTYSLALPSVLLPQYDTYPVFDLAAHQVTWTERSGGTQPDLVRAEIAVYRDDIPSGRSWHWRIVAPRTGTTVTFPTLPATPFDFNPQGNDTVSVSELTTARVPGGYAVWRTHGFAPMGTAVLGASGTAVVQLLHFDEL